MIFDIIVIHSFKISKLKTPIGSRSQTYVNERKDIFKTNGSILYESIVSTKFLVNQHFLRNKHKKKIKNLKNQISKKN